MGQNPIAALFGQLWGAKTLVPAGIGKQSDMRVSQAHGSKHNAAYNGNLFQGANPSGVTTSAGLATTCVGLILSNPAANTFNLSLRRVSGSFIVAPATVTAIGLITGYVAAGVVTHTTALTPASSLIGGTATPTAKLDSAATIVGTPAWTQWFAETPTAITLPAFNLDLEGGILLPPGAYAAIGTSIAGPASGFVGSFEWEEIPL